MQKKNIGSHFLLVKSIGLGVKLVLLILSNLLILTIKAGKVITTRTSI